MLPSGEAGETLCRLMSRLLRSRWKETLSSSPLTSATRSNDSGGRFYSVYCSAWPLPVPINQRDRLQAAAGKSITSLHPQQGEKGRYRWKHRKTPLPLPGPNEGLMLAPTWLRGPWKWGIWCYVHYFKDSNGNWTPIQITELTYSPLPPSFHPFLPLLSMAYLLQPRPCAKC